MEKLIFIDSLIKMPLMDLPVRSVLVPVSEGSVLISPGSKVHRDRYHQISQMLRVTDIVGPNTFHLAGVPKAKSIFKEASAWGVQGAKEKRPDIHWDKIFHQDPWPHQNELTAIPLRGLKTNEVVFIHKPSKSLIIADLCFNLTQASGIGAWVILSLFGTYRKFGVSRFLMRMVTDTIQFKQSLQEILSYDFENIIPSHGDCITSNGKDILNRAFAERGIQL